MAHGAPDHTILIEVNPVGYVDKDTFKETQLILAGATYDFVDELGVGGVGATYFLTDNVKAYLQILVDGWVIFGMSPEMIHDYYGLGFQGGLDLFSCTMYDDVSKKFSLIYNPRYKIVFYKSLKVRVWNQAGVAITIDKLHSLWKVRS